MSPRVALVTGARGGIGTAIAERLEADGWTVEGVDVEDADLTTREGNRLVVERALERHGRLDAIVPNAGFQHVAPVRDFPEPRRPVSFRTWERGPTALSYDPYYTPPTPAEPEEEEEDDTDDTATAPAAGTTKPAATGAAASNGVGGTGGPPSSPAQPLDP